MGGGAVVIVAVNADEVTGLVVGVELGESRRGEYGVQVCVCVRERERERFYSASFSYTL